MCYRSDVNLYILCQQKEHINQRKERELELMVLQKECLPKMVERF